MTTPECAVRNKVLTISLLGNAALLTFWLAGGSEYAGARLPVPVVAERQAPPAPAGDVARWQALGLEAIEVERLSLATLEAQEFNALARRAER